MARQRAPVQVNQFIGGLNTEANPLSFPENASIDEQNMALNHDGSRSRRDGFDVEVGALYVDTAISYNPLVKLGRSMFRWEAPGGNSDKMFLVVQVGNYLAVHDADISPISTTPIYSVTFNSSTYSTDYSYDSIDGNLVIATGLKTPSVLTYDGTNITKTDITLLVRDFWGVEATVSSVLLTSADYLSFRPSTYNAAHLYNLRNQTFATPRMEGDADTVNIVDPVVEFNSYAGAYPSNADNVIPHLFADPNKTTNRTAERFNAQSMYKTLPGNTVAPRGYFIIDALSRGASRNAQEVLLRARLPTVTGSYLTVGSLPTDSTPGGPTIVASYAGRAWYAGFSGVVSGGDSKSPHMDSYVLFSRQVQSRSDLPLCFQEGDPTSENSPDVVDTDGGAIKIEGVNKIVAMVPLETSLFILAENGVWRISGSDENSFTATSFSVSKVSTSGCISAASTIPVPSGVFYWGDDGVYLVGMNEAGVWASQNISRETVQTHYEAIDPEEKRGATGYYDADAPAVRWVYGHGLTPLAATSELIFDLKYKAFTKNRILSVTDIFGPLSAVGGLNRVKPNFSILKPKSNFFVILASVDPTLTYTFGGYKEGNILDWVSGIELGIDSEAYLIAGSQNKGSARLRKDVPYLTTFFARGDETINSCFVNAQWDWTSSDLSNRWTEPRQAYRLLRSDTGRTMVVTKNKIRGGGKAVAFKFASEHGKTFQLYGWEFNLEATTEE